MELLKTYNDIITNQSKWNPTLVNIGVNFTELFDPNKFETQNLLTSLLFWESNTCDFAINTHKIRCNMGYNRQAHTISLFLLGIEVASKIGFNKFSLPKWDTNEQRNFLHFWAITCLCHDIGYYFEKEYTQNYPKSIDELMEILGAKFDLRDNSNKTILEGYYKFSIEREYHKHVDHGIVGAVLLFDLLMRRFKEMSDLEANGAIIVSEKKQYGKELEEHALKYANSISKHNMWFADKSTENQYREYGLDALIPKKDNSHRYVFSDDPLFFLLCILDSLEPIKLNDYNSDVLSNTEILVNNDTEQIIITLISSTINFYEKASTLESWMNLQVTPIADGCKIQIL